MCLVSLTPSLGCIGIVMFVWWVRVVRELTEAGVILPSGCTPLALKNKFTESTRPRPSHTPFGCPSPGPTPLPVPGDQPFWASPGSPLWQDWEASAMQLQNMNSKCCCAADSRRTYCLAVLLILLSHKISDVAAPNKLYRCCFLRVLSARLTRHSRKQLLPYSWWRFPVSKASSSHGEKSKTKTSWQDAKLGGRWGWMRVTDIGAPFYSHRNRGRKIILKLSVTGKPARR